MNALQEITSLLREHGALFVGVNVFAVQLGIPIPAVPTLIIAGALCASGDLSFTTLVTVTVLASVAADYFWYLLGRSRGGRILRLMCRISLSPDSCVRRTEEFFERSGSRSLLFAKFIPGLSTVAPPLAGASGMSPLKFLLLDGAGSLIWGLAGLGTGRIFHQAVGRVLESLEALGNWSIALIVALLALFIGVKWVERRRFYQRLRMARITPGELHALMERSAPYIIADVRTASARRRNARRIAGALAIDPDRLGDTLVDLPIDREIILYCT